MKILFNWTIMLSMLLAVSLAQADEPVSYEKMYKNILMPEKMYDDDVIEVTELFLYTCPHCFRIHPFAEKWKKTIENQKDVKFNPMPAIFSEHNTPLAKAYYVTKELGKDEIHIALFEAIHEKGRRIVTEDQIKAFFAEHGVDKGLFEKTYNSFSVDNAIRTAHFLTASYGISGVPTVVVNGKYLVLGDKTKGYQGIFDVVDYLIDKERKLIAEKAEKTEAVTE